MKTGADYYFDRTGWGGQRDGANWQENLKSSRHNNLKMVQRNSLIYARHENLIFIRRNNLTIAQDIGYGFTVRKARGVAPTASQAPERQWRSGHTGEGHATHPQGASQGQWLSAGSHEGLVRSQPARRKRR